MTAIVPHLAVSFLQWFPLVFVGTLFTAMGLAKLFGAVRGVEGGADKPLATRLCGT